MEHIGGSVGCVYVCVCVCECVSGIKSTYYIYYGAVLCPAVAGLA